MELIQLEQGSKEWLDFRSDRFNASEAPALMGASKYKTRLQLLDEKSGAQGEVITPAKQMLFDKGHTAEDDARSVLEFETMDSYSPCVGIADYFADNTPEAHCLPLLASFDGRSDDGDHDFEHKLWNKTLAENVRNKTLEPSYYWQLEHQLIISESDYCLFVVSDGTANKREMMKYYPVPGRKEELILAWVQFQLDLEVHEIKAKKEIVIANEQEKFPIIECSVVGSEVTSNLGDFIPRIKQAIDERLSLVLQTDQDFADNDLFVKNIKSTRSLLKAKAADVLSKFESFNKFDSDCATTDGILQKAESALAKASKNNKDAKKLSIKTNAQKSLLDHLSQLSEAINKVQITQVVVDWDEVIKGKRSFEKMEGAVDAELANAKIKSNEICLVIRENLDSLSELAKNHKFLFSDHAMLLLKDNDDLINLIKARITEHEAAETKRLAKIKEDALIKAKKIADKKLEDDKAAIRKQEREKVEAEQKVINEHVDAIKINGEFDDFKKKEKLEPVVNQAPVQGHATVLTTDAQTVKQPIASDNFNGESVSQLQKKINNIEAQSTHVPPHVDFLNWARDYSIDNDAFSALEVLIKKHLTK